MLETPFIPESIRLSESNTCHSHCLQSLPTLSCCFSYSVRFFEGCGFFRVDFLFLLSTFLLSFFSLRFVFFVKRIVVCTESARLAHVSWGRVLAYFTRGSAALISCVD